VLLKLLCAMVDQYQRPMNLFMPVMLYFVTVEVFNIVAVMKRHCALSSMHASYSE